MGFKDITQLAMASCNVACASWFIYLDGRHNNQFLKVSIMNLSHFREVGIEISFMKKPVLHNVLWVVLERRSKEIKLRLTHTISRYFFLKKIPQASLKRRFPLSLFRRIFWISVAFPTPCLIAVAYPTVEGVAFPTPFLDCRRFSDAFLIAVAYPTVSGVA